jgi:signal recognition particle receptor subunit alpha
MSNHQKVHQHHHLLWPRKYPHNATGYANHFLLILFNLEQRSRVWQKEKISKSYAYLGRKLDGQEHEDATLANAESLVDRSKMGNIVDGYYEVQDVDYGDDDEEDIFDEEDGELATKPAAKSSGVFGFFKNLTGQREIDAATLEPVLQKMKTHLIDKNVASNISQHLCDSVQSSLLCTKLGTFGSMLM